MSHKKTRKFYVVYFTVELHTCVIISAHEIEASAKIGFKKTTGYNMELNQQSFGIIGDINGEWHNIATGVAVPWFAKFVW